MASEAAPSRLKRLIGALLVLGVMVTLVLTRCEGTQKTHARGRERGLIALHQALSGDTSAFAKAQRKLAQAAGAVIYDAGPLFALEVSKALQGQASGLAPEAKPILEALKQQHYEQALTLAAGLETSLSFREALIDLCAEMVRIQKGEATR